MTPTELNEVSLDKLGNGAALELFDRELRRVIENIADVNTEAEAKRKITITVEIMPHESRDSAAVKIQAKSNIAPYKGHGTVVHIGRETKGGPLTALERNQRDFFEDEESGAEVDGDTGEVTPIDRKEA